MTSGDKDSTERCLERVVEMMVHKDAIYNGGSGDLIDTTGI